MNWGQRLYKHVSVVDSRSHLKSVFHRTLKRAQAHMHGGLQAPLVREQWLLLHRPHGAGGTYCEL